MTKLTPAMRLFLSNPHNGTLPTWDFIQRFIKHFELDAHQAGGLIAQWIKETA